MTAAVVLLVVLVLVGTGCSNEAPRPVKGPQLVTFGHSYVSGREPDYDVTPWPERAGRILALPVDNRGVSGAEAVETLGLVRAYEPAPQDTVVIECILNDALRHGRGGLSVWRRSVDAMLAHLMPAVPAQQIVLVLDPPPRGSDELSTEDEPFTRTLRRYADAGRALARQHGVRVLDLASGWDTSRDLSDDGLHPSEAGTQRITDLVAAAVRRR